MSVDDLLRPTPGRHHRSAGDRPYPAPPPRADPEGIAESAFCGCLRAAATVVDTASDAAVLLADPRRLVLVESGAVDLFAARIAGGVPIGRWTPLCRLTAGAVLGPGSPPGPAHALIGRPVPGTVLSALPLRRIQTLSGAEDLDPAVDSGAGSDSGADGNADVPPVADQLDLLQAAGEIVTGLETSLGALTRAMRYSLPPREFEPLEPCGEQNLDVGAVVRSVAGVLWVDVVEGAVNAGHGGAAASYASGDRICVTELDWLTATVPTRLRVRTTTAVLRADELVKALLLNAFRFGYAVDRAVEAQREREIGQLGTIRENEHRTDRAVSSAFAELIAQSAGGQAPPTADRGDRALRCVQVVGRRIGLMVEQDADPDLPGGDRAAVEQIAARAGAPSRGVRLVGRWWRKDRGPLIGFRRQDGHAVALLPVPRGYLLHDPEAGGVTRLDPSVAKTVRIDAVMLYRSLTRQVTGVGSLFRFGIAGGRSDLLRFLGVASVVALLGLLVPVLTGTVLGTWVPAAQRPLLIGAAVVIIGSGLVTAALTVVQNTAVLRLEGKLDLSMQAAVWARLMALPTSFFSRFAAAELGTVALGVSAARETLSSVSTVAALGLLSGLVNLGVLYFFSVPLAAIGTVMVAISAAVSVLLARRGIRRQRELYRSEQRLASRSYQFLSGLSTLRLAAAEGRAYAQWSRTLAENLRHGLSVRRAQAAVTVFNSGFAVVATLGIFALVGGPFHSRVSLAAFLAFFTAFNQVLGALVQFCSAGVAALAVVPVLEGLQPILTAEPELREEMSSPGDLEGRIEVRTVSFRYGDGPAVLDGISFEVNPGEFVALVGSTGSGKSTVLRLLLGFEEPQSGSILFDGQDIRRLDAGALRRQCGVVLQNGALLAGDVATNIIAGTDHSVEDAWRAAELAGIADDIRAMPMGMNTVIPEGGLTLSGGQRQRLMIARALISSPRILFFDEATSALDNQTQRIVTESTRRLNASRLVIAHRLSTIEHADRIVVLDQGVVAQVGTYAELVADRAGVFARLVRRQMDEDAR